MFHWKTSDLLNKTQVCSNWLTPKLLEAAVCGQEGMLSEHGAFVVQTGKYTGRSPNDRFIVEDENTREKVFFGKINQPISQEAANGLYEKVSRYLLSRPHLFVQDVYAGASKAHRMGIRVVTQRAWHSAFVRNMFICPKKEEYAAFQPDFLVLHAPGFHANPKEDKTQTETAIVIDFTKRFIVICGTEYAGEIKKSIFSVFNFLLPETGVLGMHCSANMDDAQHTALFFGLSGTGKTTLSADPKRHLIGDDEHGWGESGIFNLEGGCYAKVIRLNPQDEPQIFHTTRTFGTLLENVVINPDTRMLDLQSELYTENTRASYPIDQIQHAKRDGLGSHPTHLVMLTCDAFGVFPPIACLTKQEAMYHFLNGYTARVAGTERGITEPKAVFSACFGAPFMPRHPFVYAELLGQKIEKHGVRCFMVNTGWWKGPYGVGERMKIQWTRALLNAALTGQLDNVAQKPHPLFRMHVPTVAPHVPKEILDPRTTWSDPLAYDRAAKHVAELFESNFTAYRSHLPLI